jgi:hypothetical protein
LKGIREIKSFASPPKEVAGILNIVCGYILQKKKKGIDYNDSKKMLHDPNRFLKKLRDFNYSSIENW